MLINLIVTGATVLVGGLVVAWCVSPRLRSAVEQPKYDLARRERLFGKVNREE